MLKANPINDKIIVKMNPIQETTNSGIFIPVNQQLEQQGVVVAVGNRVKLCKIGDIIQKFYAVDGVFYEEDGVEYLIFKESRDIEFVNDKLI